MSERQYRGYRVYAYIALGRLFAELDLDLQQSDVVPRATERLRVYAGRVSKEEILHAIRSNSHMTDKVLRYLAGEGFVELRKDERGYDIRITASGVAHLAAYHRLYRELFARELSQHYRYVRAPDWLG